MLVNSFKASVPEVGRGGVRYPLWPSIFFGLFGAGWAVSFDFGVRVYGAEIVAAFGLLLIDWRPLLSRYPRLRSVLLAYALWIMAIAVSDLVNATAIFDSLRHIATPLIGSTSLIFVLAVLSKQPSALLWFLAAAAVTKGVLGEAQYGDTFADQSLSWSSVQADTNFFKVRIEPFLTPAFLLVAYWLGGRSLLRPAVMFVLVSVGYLAVDARSSGLVFFLSGLALACLHFGLFRMQKSRAIVVAISAAILAYGGYVAYVDYTLKYSADGHNGKQLQRLENPYNPFELLAQGRSEWLVMPEAIAQKPLFGWGSWAEDVDLRFAYLRIDRAGTENYSAIAGVANRIYIPAHSLVGSAWVWSGILGLIALVWLLRTVLSMSVKLADIRTRLVAPAVFMVGLLLWHYFFSPPQMVRLYFPTALGLLICLTWTGAPRRNTIRE